MRNVRAFEDQHLLKGTPYTGAVAQGISLAKIQDSCAKAVLKLPATTRRTSNLVNDLRDWNGRPRTRNEAYCPSPNAESCPQPNSFRLKSTSSPSIHAAKNNHIDSSLQQSCFDCEMSAASLRRTGPARRDARSSPRGHQPIRARSGAWKVKAPPGRILA